MNTKSCRVCKLFKEFGSFHKALGNKDGYNNRCKECQKEYNTQYHSQQKEKHIQTPPAPLPKKCPKCNNVKPFKDFYRSNCSKTGITSFCKTCASEKGKEWEKKNKEKNKQKSRVSSLKRNYGLTPQDYKKMLNRQNGLCCICKTNDPGKNKLYFTVDHCHATGVVRGLLCVKCNCALGLLNDNPALFVAAKNYLEKQNDPDLI